MPLRGVRSLSKGGLLRTARFDTLVVTTLGLGAAIAFVAAARLLVPRERVPPPRVRSILLDVSASVTRAAPSAGRFLRAVLAREAERARERHEEILVVSVAADCRRIFGPGDPERLLELLEGRGGEPLEPVAAEDSGADLGSELARGVRLIDEILASHGAAGGSLRLVGDGSYTGDDPAPHVERLRGLGIDWLGVDPVPRERFDAAVIDLRVPLRIESGAPLAATAVVLLHPGADVLPPEHVLEVAVEDALGRRAVEQPLALVPLVPTAVTVQLGSPAEGRTRVSARVRPRVGFDPTPENDELDAAVRVGESLVVGVVRPSELEADVAAFLEPAPPGIDLLSLSSGELPAALHGLDAVLAFDVPLDELPAALLSTFVRTGGGLFVAGGFRALAGWSAEPRPGELARILPLRPDPGADEPRRVIVLVDGSGSMQGEPFELVRTAVRELVRAAPPRDEIELCFFTAVLHPARTLRRQDSSSSEAADLARQLLDARVPGGSTRIVESLEQLVSKREGAEDRALVLLLTDGREPPDVIRAEERARQAAAALAGLRTELVVFAVGPQSDRRFLTWLAGTEEAIRSTDELAGLAELFRREVNRERTRQGEIEVFAREGGLAAQVLGPRARFEPIARHLRCTARLGAEVVLASGDGEPILGVAREALGRTAALATLPFGDWAPNGVWRSADFLPLFRWLARRSAPAPPFVVVEGSKLLVRGADGLPPRVEAHLRTGTGIGTTRPLVLYREAATPGVLGAEIPADVERVGNASLVLSGAADDGGELVLPCAWPRPAEFSDPSRRLALSPAVAASAAVRFDDGGGGRGEPTTGATRLLLAGTGLGLTAGLAFARQGRRRGSPRQGHRPTSR